MSIQVGGLRVAVTAIVPAAGSGKRMGGGTAKQFLSLRGEPVLVHTVRLLSQSTLIDEIVIAAQDTERTSQLVGQIPKVTRVVHGGETRQDSVRAAVRAVHSRPRILCVHDAARPLLSMEVLDSVLLAAAQYRAQVVAVPVKDTVKVADDAGFVAATPDRSSLWAVQTPQVFWAETLVQAFEKAAEEGFVGTDCASLVERLGIPVHIYPGSHANLKLTTPEDLLYAEAILTEQS